MRAAFRNRRRGRDDGAVSLDGRAMSVDARKHRRTILNWRPSDLQIMSRSDFDGP